ncbi:hypothetical protein CKM354_000779100 [Cercospora kikuchii]|uniref:Adenylate kinase n=1 Tax=Cercospora kikuchii TaxID=84275 RepID=A0A9P3FHS8_9PEZI|nr:uncharacterized protein CKM354_000779100 [Cercospora kikuchii]GIZ44597.1 hypothetical protein CKM354_000779100 [Cercospora kikuchii]
MLPMILLLGPCGIGKGTFAATLIQNHNIHHLSCGDWLRSKTISPILGVSDTNINDYVALDFDIPEAWLIASYGPEWKEHAPPALVLYVCSKRNESTPTKVILQRFLSRSRANDDVKTFERRLRRFEKESPAVIGKYRNLGKLVEVEAMGTPEEVYQKVMSALKGHKVWRVISSDTDQLASGTHQARLPSVVTKLERSRAKKLSPIVAKGFSGSGFVSAPVESPV